MATIERRGDGWRVKVRLKGEKPRTRTFERKTDATLWAHKVESDLGHRVYVPTTADRRRTVADLIDKFTTEQLPHRAQNADAKKLTAQLKWWRADIGHLTLDRLTPSEIAACRLRLLSRETGRKAPTASSNAPPVTISPATVNRYLAALSAVCKWAWKVQRWLPSNPVLDVQKGKEHSGIIRFLSDDERKALLTACRASKDANIYCAVVLALATGTRASNIRNLTWADVDLDLWRLRFAHTKNGQPRYMPIAGAVQHAIKEHFDRDPTKHGWVFKGYRDESPADIDRPWRAVRKAAGLVGEHHLRFHDLRHTTGSYLLMSGASAFEIAAALGQTTLVMAQRYSHQSAEHVRSTVERISERLSQE